MKTNLRAKAPKIHQVVRAVRQERIRADKMDLFGEQPPVDLLTPYVVAEADKPRVAKLHRKYTNRARNIRRAWNRVQLYLPELLTSDTPQDVFEMSTAHGAMLEVLRYFGHSVLGNDFANMVRPTDTEERAQFRGLNDESFSRGVDDYGIPISVSRSDTPDWPYRSIIEAANLPMAVFDGGHVPYPLQDKSFDVTICMQAIEHYCHPRDWMAIIDEFCRVSNKTVLVMLNRLIGSLEADKEYAGDFNAFRRQMRGYHRNGFACTACFMHWGGANVFKLTATPS